MELVGQALAYREESEGLWLLFRCTNREEFEMKVSPAIKRIPPDLVVRAWAKKPTDKQGTPSKTNVLTHWEEL